MEGEFLIQLSLSKPTKKVVVRSPDPQSCLTNIGKIRSRRETRTRSYKEVTYDHRSPTSCYYYDRTGGFFSVTKGRTKGGFVFVCLAYDYRSNNVYVRTL